MRLDEIDRIPPFNKDYSMAHQQSGLSFKKLPGNAGLLYTVEKDYDIIKIRIYQQLDKKVIGFLKVGSRSSPIPRTYEVGMVNVDPSWRGKGIAKALYGIALTILNINLFAGDSQSPGGRRNWISLSNIPGCEVVGWAMMGTGQFDSDGSSFDKERLDTRINNIMSIGGEYIGKHNNRYWFIYPVTAGKDELANAMADSPIKVYHSISYNGEWTTGLLARWIG